MEAAQVKITYLLLIFFLIICAAYLPIYYWYEMRWNYFDHFITAKFPVPNPYIETYNIFWEKIHSLAIFLLSSASILAIRPYISLKQYVLSVEKNFIIRLFISIWLYTSADLIDRLNNIWWLTDLDVVMYIWDGWYIFNTFFMKIKNKNETCV